MPRVPIGPLTIAALLVGCASLTPPPNEVTVKRDTYGVPHIYARDTRDLFYGFGYALAEDRLYQLEMTKRSGNGSVAEVLGTDYIGIDAATRSSLDPASIRAQLATLGPDDRAMFEGYAAGISSRVREVLADREKLLPREFIDNGFEPTLWTVDDVAMVWIGLILNRFFAGTTEVANLALLHQLKTARRRNRPADLRSTALARRSHGADHHSAGEPTAGHAAANRACRLGAGAAVRGGSP